MAIRSVLQKMLDQGGNGISPEEFEEVKSFTSTFPNSKGILQKMLDQGGNGISPEEFEQIKTWSSPGMIAAKSQVQQEAQAAEDANGVLPNLVRSAKDAALSLGAQTLAGMPGQAGLLVKNDPLARDVGLSLGVQGLAGVAGQVGTLVGKNPIEAIENQVTDVLPGPLKQARFLNPLTGPLKVARAVGRTLPEEAQNALLINPDNWLTQGARDVSQWAQKQKSPELQQAEAEAESAKKAAAKEGILSEAVEVLKHPQALSAMALQSTPQLLVGGAAGKGLKIMGMGTKAATVGAGLVGSAMQSADNWQDTYFDILDQPVENFQKVDEYNALISNGVSEDVARRAVARKLAERSMAISFPLSAATTMIPGGNAVEGLLVGGATRGAARSTLGRIAGKTAAVLGEPLQESAEEGSAKWAGNVAENPVTGVSPWEGVPSAASAGMALGGLFNVPGMTSHLAKGNVPQPTTVAPATGEIAPAPEPIEQAPVAPTAPVAPAVPTQEIPETQPDLASRAMAAKRRGVEEDFAEFSNQGPEFAQKVAEWRGQNPNGEFDQFDVWIRTQPRVQADAAVQSDPEVVQAQADASQAQQKVEAAQQVPNSDPTQAPPPGLTAEEARDIQQNGTENIEKEAKAAQEQARTVAQTKAKEIEQNSSDTPRIKAAAEAVKQSRKERKAQAKEAFTSKIKAMSEGAMEWNEDVVRTLAEDAGIGPDAIEAKLASARARLEKVKAAKEKKAGKEEATPEPTPEPTLAPAETKVEEAKAEFTPPTQGAEIPGIDSAPTSDLEAQFAEEIAQEHINKGFKKANELYKKLAKSNPELKQIDQQMLFEKVRDITDMQGVPFSNEWKTYNERKKIPGGLNSENMSDEEIAHFVYNEYRRKGESKGNSLYRKFFGKMNPESKADFDIQRKRRDSVAKMVVSLLERNGIPFERGWMPPKKVATESVAQADTVTEAPVEETPNEDGVMPIEQPEDGTVLSDIQDSGLDKVPKSMDGVYPLDSVPGGSTPAEIVGVIHSVGSDEGMVVFRHKDGYLKILQSTFKGMAQGDTGWSVDGHTIIAERSDGSVVATSPMDITRFDEDYIARLERQPVQDSQERFIRSVSPDSIMDAAERTGVSANDASEAADQWQEAMVDIAAAEDFTAEMGKIADSGADLSMSQLNALAERAARASRNVQATFAKMLPALEILATAEALDLMENSPAPRLDRADISIAKGWGFYHELEQIAESSMPRWAGSSSRAADYIAWKFQEHTGKPVTDATADEIRVWAQNQVRLNANNLPAWMWAAMGGAGALAAGGIFGGPGALQAIATGLLAIKAIQALKWAWGKFAKSANSPREQIMRAVSTAKHSSADIISMLDQAFLRAMEIKGPAKDKMRSIKKKYFSFTGKEKFPALGRAISNLIEGKDFIPVEGMTNAQVEEATQSVRGILGYFRRLMEARGMPVLENYLPRMTHSEGFAEMMADSVAYKAVLEDTAQKVEETMSESVTEKVHELAMKSWSYATNAERRRAAALEIASDILKKRANEAETEKFGVAKKDYTRLASPSPTKARSLPFDLMEEVKDSHGKILPLIERDAFKIMDRYIPSMSRAIAQRETVNKHRINQWLDGLQLPMGADPQGEKSSQYRSRILSYVQNDLDQSLSRVLTAGNMAKHARNIRIANTVRFLALSVWYPMMNLSFGSPLAFGMTGVRGGMSYTSRMMAAMFGFGKKDAEVAGAITDGIFHDITAGEGSKVGRVVDLVNTPSSWSQEAVDVGGFYAGRTVAPRLLQRAKKGDLHSKKMLGDALGEQDARDAMDRGVLTNEEMNRIGLFFKTKISGTARSLNLPSFMGTDLGRTIFQFGSIPMEQTKTLVEDILGSGKSFGASRNSGTFAVGAGLAGLASLAKLAGMSALSTEVMGNPESDRRKWMRKQSAFELLLWAAVKGGSFQLLTPLFDKIGETPSAKGYKKTIMDLLPMPAASVASLVDAGLESGSRVPGALRDPSLEKVPYVYLPVIRDLVNNQTSMFRGLGIKIPNQTRLEKRIGKQD